MKFGLPALLSVWKFPAEHYIMKMRKKILYEQKIRLQHIIKHVFFLGLKNIYDFFNFNMIMLLYQKSRMHILQSIQRISSNIIIELVVSTFFFLENVVLWKPTYFCVSGWFKSEIYNESNGFFFFCHNTHEVTTNKNRRLSSENFLLNLKYIVLKEQWWHQRSFKLK